MKTVLAVLALALAMLASPSDAAARHHHHSVMVHHARAHVASTRRAARHRASHRHRYASTRLPRSSAPASFTFGAGDGGGGLVSTFRQFLGQHPVARGSLWCADMMNFVLRRVGLRGTNSSLASSFRSLQHTSPGAGAIVAWGHHVGLITGGPDASGRYPVISGNDGRTTRERYRSIAGASVVRPI